MSKQLDHFYDGQLRRYITQMIRMMSGFSYKDSSGEVTTVPAMYGDLTRQVANIIRNNSENKIPNAPRMALYVTGLELDTSRLADSSYVNKVNIREREFDTAGNEYLNTEGKNYTVERLMPTPYTLTVSVDLWSTNTDQKLQILEQILMLFNPSLELQTTDNYLDWTSLSTVYLDGITWSSRSIPQGTETEIDVSTLSFTTPIYISPPAKVKRLGVITDIVSRIHNSKQELIDATTDIDFSLPEGDADIQTDLFVNESGDIERATTRKDYDTEQSVLAILKTTYQNIDLLVMNNTLQLVKNGNVGGISWWQFLEAFPFKFEEGISTIRLQRPDLPTEIVGIFAISTADTEAVVNWDEDSIPTDTVIPGPNGSRSKIDFIIDPINIPEDSPVNFFRDRNYNLIDKETPRGEKFKEYASNFSNNLEDIKSPGLRILLLNDISKDENTDGADAWKNQDGSDFTASANDILEWSGTEWQIVFDSNGSDSTVTPVYTTNLNTGVQYKFENSEWRLSFEGEYPNGTWRIEF